MIKNELFVYLGDNGTITTGVYLPGTPCVKKYQLIADKKKLLTDGSKKVSTIIIPERDLDNWYEIDGQD